jgi:hypothetical protein
MRFVIAVGGFVPRRRQPGADDVARTSLRCGACRAPIGEGEVYALVTDAELRRCLDCATAMTEATWDARGWCPWPFQVAADAARATDGVDFAGRLRAALERSRAATRPAA